MKIITLCVALAICAGSTAFAQQVQPSSKNPQLQVKESALNKGTADGNQRYSEAIPLPVRLLNTGKSDAEAKQDEEERQEKALNDRRMTGFTAGLLLVALAQLALFFFQLKFMRKNLADTEIAAKAAKQGADAAMQSVETMKDIAVRQMRAYVFVVESEVINLDNDGAPLVKLVVTNVGQTPAYNLTKWTILGRNEHEITRPRPDLRLSKTNLGAGAQLLDLIPTIDRTIPFDQMMEYKAALIRGEIPMWIWGEINYTDAFQIERCTKFRLEFRGTGDIKYTQLTPCQHGNEAT